MLNEKLIELVEKGNQVGKVFSFNEDENTIWSSVAIQKWGVVYKVYIDEIDEKMMGAEDYIREVIVSFDDIDSAISYIDTSSRTHFSELAILKGQRIFNPKFE